MLDRARSGGDAAALARGARRGDAAMSNEGEFDELMRGADARSARACAQLLDRVGGVEALIRARLRRRLDVDAGRDAASASAAAGCDDAALDLLGLRARA